MWMHKWRRNKYTLNNFVYLKKIKKEPYAGNQMTGCGSNIVFIFVCISFCYFSISILILCLFIVCSVSFLYWDHVSPWTMNHEQKNEVDPSYLILNFLNPFSSKCLSMEKEKKVNTIIKANRKTNEIKESWNFF